MQQFTTHIKSKNGWFDIDLKEVYKYKDLIFLFVKRNYTTRYKQTILGPLWQIINPMLTVSLYALVFGNIAGLSTDGVPHFVFYLCSNALWTYFAACITTTANTFTANSAILGKVYFPRIVMPISAIITAAFDLLIQLGLLTVIMIGFAISGVHFPIGVSIMLAPVFLIQAALLGMGCGIIIASLTTKYRDLAVLVSFGVQLWMYASPVVYASSQIPERFYNIYMLNPMAPIITMWRNVILGTDAFNLGFWGISWVLTAIILFVGILLFNRIEKTFMDTV